jgi:long-chain acyl-CoA synthetase
VGELTDDAARTAVIARLDALFTQWAHEQAIELSEHGTRRWWSWRDVAAVHDAIVGVLDERELPDGGPVAIVMRQRPALVATQMSVLAEGRTALLVSPIQSDLSLVDDVVSLQPSVLVAHAVDWARPGLIDAVASAGVLGVEVADDGAVCIRVDVDTIRPGIAVDAAVTVLTSGTTGPAKRLRVAWDDFVRLGGGPEGRPPVSGRGALILAVPLVSLGGLLSMSRLVFGGRPMAMLERFDVREWAALVKEHRPKVMGAPPPVVAMILEAGISPDHFEGVTAYLTSSAPVAPEMAEAFERRYGIPVLLGYGATEFLNSVTGWTTELWAEFGATKLGSVGRALPGVRLRVITPDAPGDAEPVEVPTGEEGILEVDPPQRAGELPSGWLRTSDRARLDSDGFLWILGRADDVIIRGGFKVDLTQVEAAARRHPGVLAACAVGLPDDRLGQVPGVAVTVLPGPSTPSEADLEAWLRAELPPYAVPAVITIVDEIPQTATLKAHRAAVQQILVHDR